jgi:beta-fructofuranosidase
MIIASLQQGEIPGLKQLFGNQTASAHIEPQKWICESRSGYEIFYFQKPSSSFIWEGLLTMEGLGKLGLVTDIDLDGNGYFISFDMSVGIVNIRSWGFNPLNSRHNFIFDNIQSGTFKINQNKGIYFKLIRYGNYIELSIDGEVKLSLMDYTYSGPGLGIYAASSIISLQDTVVKTLPDPPGEYASQEDSQKKP